MHSVSDRYSLRRREVLAARARGMRVAPTPSEERLWKVLRGRRLIVQFRRQVPIGRYIVDFLAPTVKLVVDPPDASLRDVSRKHLIVETDGSNRLRLTDISSHGTSLPPKFLDHTSI